MAESDGDLLPSRRNFLKILSTATTGILITGGLAGCGEDEMPEMLVGTLEDLRKNGFLSPKFNGKRIFTTELEGELTTFSMVCRHKKCTVGWEADVKEFQCPCHEGRYDAKGNVLDGPPPRPLFRFKTEVRGEEIWVLNEYQPSNA